MITGHIFLLCINDRRGNGKKWEFVSPLNGGTSNSDSLAALKQEDPMLIILVKDRELRCTNRKCVFGLKIVINANTRSRELYKHSEHLPSCMVHERRGVSKKTKKYIQDTYWRNNTVPTPMEIEASLHKANHERYLEFFCSVLRIATCII